MPNKGIFMDLSIQTIVAMGLLTALAVGFAAVDTRGGIIHFKTEPWTKHAMFHAVTGLIYTIALCVLVVVLTWIPFRQGEWWSWWAILFIGVSIHGGHFLVDALTKGGLRGGGTAQGPGMVFYWATGFALIMYAVSLGLSYSHFR